jgi:hypothetical protein
MKFQGPKGTTGASVGGQFFPANKRGVIETPDDGEYAWALAPHGFTPIADKVAQEDEEAAEVADAAAETQEQPAA